MIVFSKHISSLNPKQKRSSLALLLAVLLLRSRLITAPRDVLVALKKVAGIQKPTPEELDQARQQLYRKNPDGTKSLFVAYRNRISEVSTICLGKAVTMAELGTDQYSPNIPGRTECERKELSAGTTITQTQCGPRFPSSTNRNPSYRLPIVEVEGSIHPNPPFDLPCAAHRPECCRCEA